MNTDQQIFGDGPDALIEDRRHELRQLLNQVLQRNATALQTRISSSERIGQTVTTNFVGLQRIDALREEEFGDLEPTRPRAVVHHVVT